jgi:hypothetical protein
LSRHRTGDDHHDHVPSDPGHPGGAIDGDDSGRAGDHAAGDRAHATDGHDPSHAGSGVECAGYDLECYGIDVGRRDHHEHDNVGHAGDYDEHRVGWGHDDALARCG